MMFIIVNAEGQALGRMTLTSPLGWVEPMHAYTFTSVDREVLAIQANYPGAQIQQIRG
jgi:hypothetical protein